MITLVRKKMRGRVRARSRSSSLRLKRWPISGRSFGKTDLPVHQQQSCEIVDSKTIVLGIGKCPFCVLYFAATVSHEVSQNGGVTAYDFDPPAALFQNAEVCSTSPVFARSTLCCIACRPLFPWTFHVFVPRISRSEPSTAKDDSCPHGG